MKMTDEQYKQIFRYVDDEMDAIEQKAFETALAENNELYDEVVFYKEVRLVSESVEQKICNTDPLLSEEKKSKDEEVWAMISQSRKNWEIQEDQLKLKYGISPIELKYIQRKQHGKVRKISISTWLVAAVLTGLICLSVVVWYSQNIKNDSKVAINKKEEDSQVVNNNNKIDNQENTITPVPPIPQENTPSKNIARNDKKGIVEQNKNSVAKPGTKKIFNIETDKRIALFDSIFKPDDAPANVTSRLRKAFADYNASNYENALLAFDKSETLVKRGFDESKELTAFYTHYYKAQSYLAIDSAARAVPNLKTAITTSPDNFWKNKAQWYLALAYLKTGDLKETEDLLKRLAKDNQAGEYKEKAIILMKDLNTFLAD